MVVLAYTPDLNTIVGQIQVNVDFLPSLQNGKYFDPIAPINANIASVGASIDAPYWIDWNATFVNSLTTKNAPILQSPLKSTFLAIVAILSGGSVWDQHYLNFQAQSLPFYGFWNKSPAVTYPTEPGSVIVGSISEIAPGLAGINNRGDSLCIYPQYIEPPSLELFFNFRATILQTGTDYALTNFPAQFDF